MLRTEEARRPYTVSELAREIQRELAGLTAVLVKGEVSGMRQSARGAIGSCPITHDTSSNRFGRMNKISKITC